MHLFTSLILLAAAFHDMMAPCIICYMLGIVGIIRIFFKSSQSMISNAVL